MTRIEKLRGLLAKATSGPWLVDIHDGKHYKVGPALLPSGAETLEAVQKAAVDATLITESRNELPRLLDLVEVMREALSFCHTYSTPGSRAADLDLIEISEVAKEALTAYAKWNEQP